MIPLDREYPELKALRDRIDAVDDEFIRLLKERSAIVRDVGLLKRERGEERNFIRPDREARMIRRIAKAFADAPFSARAATAIWRLVIGASTAMEAPLRLVIAGEAGLLPAREHFGPSLPCRLFETRQAMEEMRHDSHAIGIFPLEARTGDGLPWWRLQNEKAIHVFACLPFIRSPEADAALASSPVFATARIDPTDSGHDRTLFILREGATLSPGMTVLAEHGGERLVEIDGWAAPGTTVYSALEEAAGASQFTYIGGYAIPFFAE